MSKVISGHLFESRDHSLAIAFNNCLAIRSILCSAATRIHHKARDRLKNCKTYSKKNVGESVVCYRKNALSRAGKQVAEAELTIEVNTR